MDILSIEKLKVETTIGVLDWERQIKQTLYFDLQWSTDAAKLAETDAISDALDYSLISSALQKFVEESTFFLIETLAEKAAEFLFSNFHIDWLKIKLTKPGAINHAQNVSVSIERNSISTYRRFGNGDDNSK
jgi:7,8-dihydroneopterin aldolase/epimerase/oxygenase